MDSIWIGSYKLRVNIPAFERDCPGAQTVTTKEYVLNGGTNKNALKVGGRSYLRAVVDGRSIHQEHGPPKRNVRKDSVLRSRWNG